jgi:hypothetical protein
MDRIDRINDEGGMMNNKQLVFHSSFIIHPCGIAFILSILSILFGARLANIFGSKDKRVTFHHEKP